MRAVGQGAEHYRSCSSLKTCRFKELEKPLLRIGENRDCYPGNGEMPEQLVAAVGRQIIT